MDDASRLRSKAISTGILSSTKPDHYPCLRPSRAIVECSGQDIFKRSAHRKAKYLFAFPGRIEALAGGGTIGQLSKLDTLNPELHITFPDRDGKSGVLKLKGTLVPTKNKYLTLQCNPVLAKNSSEGDSGAVICEDVFERMIVFSEAVWVGDLALNPAEIPLSLPATVGAPSSRTAAAVIDGFTYGCGKHPTKSSSAKRSLDTKAVVSGGKREGEGEEEEEEEVDELKLSQGRARRSVVGRKRILYTEADEDDIEANEEDDQLNDDDDDEDDVDQGDDRGGSNVEMYISRPKEADAPSSSSSSSSSSLQFQKRPSFSSAGGFMLSQPSPGKDKDSKGKVKEISSNMTKKPKKTREEEDDDDNEDSNGINDDDGDDDDDDDDTSEFSFDLGRSSPPPKKKSSTSAMSSTAAKSTSKQTKPSSTPKKTTQVKKSAISKRKIDDDEEEEEEEDDDVVEVTTTKRTAFRPQRQASLQKPPVYKESDNEDEDSIKKAKSKATTVKATVKTATKTKTSTTKTKKPSTKSKPTIIYVDDDEEEEDDNDDDDDSDF
jgi:hypothetical protein